MDAGHALCIWLRIVYGVFQGTGCDVIMLFVLRPKSWSYVCLNEHNDLILIVVIVALQGPLLAKPFLAVEPDTDDDSVAQATDPASLHVGTAYQIAGAIVLAACTVFFYWARSPVPGTRCLCNESCFPAQLVHQVCPRLPTTTRPQLTATL